MSSKVVVGLILIQIAAVAAHSQDSAPLSAKTLYYQADTVETKPAAKPKPVSAASPDTAANKISTQSKPAQMTPVSEKVDHLGLRYSLLRYDRKSHESAAVDPDHVFEQGDCIQLQLSPNRSGYLYVFDKGSSGKWEVLLPSSLMSDEANTIPAREPVKVPAKYCFTVENPAGTEHLFVVLSRSKQDMYSLDHAIRSQAQGVTPSTTVASAKEAPVSRIMAAANRLDAEIQKMEVGLGSRDLGVEKVAESDRPDEPADSVYVVNTSNVSSSRLVTEILIRHQ